jgi:hypothetical protein
MYDIIYDVIIKLNYGWLFVYLRTIIKKKNTNNACYELISFK